MADIGEGVTGIQGQQHLRMAEEMIDPRQREGREPGRHHGPEQEPDGAAAAALDRKQPDEDQGRERDNIGRDGGNGDLQPFDGAQNRDRRRDHGVAEEQRCASQADHQQDRLQPPGHRKRQRQERHGTALPLVVRPHDKDHVFDGHDEDDGPEHHRQHTEDRGLRRGIPGRSQRFAERVDRAGPDIAEDDAERAEEQRPPDRMFRGCGRRGRLDRGGHEPFPSVEARHPGDKLASPRTAAMGHLQRAASTSGRPMDAGLNEAVRRRRISSSFAAKTSCGRGAPPSLHCDQDL